MNTNKNTLLLVAAILISLVIWFQFKLVIVQTTNISLPIRYSNISDSSSLLELPSRIMYRVNATGFEILKLKFSGTYAQYDALNLSNDGYQIKPDKIKLDLPLSITILSIEPLVNSYETDTTTKFKKIDTKVELVFANNDVKDFFYKNNFKLSSDKVEITGPIGQLQNISSVKTEPISRKKLQESKFQLKLILSGKDISADPSYVEVIKMDQQQLTRIITHVSIKADKQFDFYPKEVTIRIRGQKDLVNSLTPDNFEANIILGDSTNGRFPIKLSLPDDIELIDLSPSFVTSVKEK